MSGLVTIVTVRSMTVNEAAITYPNSIYYQRCERADWWDNQNVDWLNMSMDKKCHTRHVNVPFTLIPHVDQHIDYRADAPLQTNTSNQADYVGTQWVRQTVYLTKLIVQQLHHYREYNLIKRKFFKEMKNFKKGHFPGPPPTRFWVFQYWKS